VRTGSEVSDTANLSGGWLVTNRIDSTSYGAFRNLRIGYRLRLTQHGNRVVGEGRRWVEDGQPLPRSRRTPIKVEGTLGGPGWSCTSSNPARDDRALAPW
jgi:hypothetical protein